MLILGFLQFLIIFVNTMYELKKKSPAVFIWAVLLIMFGIPHLLEIMTGQIEFNSSIINKASLFVLIFSFLYLMFRHITNLKYSTKIEIVSPVIDKKDLKSKNINDRKTSKILTLLIVIIIIFQLYRTIQSVGGISNISWGNLREVSTSRDYLNFDTILRIFYFILTGIMLYLFINKKYKSFAIVAVLVLLRTFMGGNRMYITPLLTVSISIVIFSVRRLKLKHYLILGILGVFTIYFIYSIRVFRHYGTLNNFFNNFVWKEFNDKVLEHLINDNGELGLRKDFYYFIENNNNFYNFNKGHTYIRMLLMPIPTRYSFGLKPPDFAQTMGSAIGMVTGGSTHPTLFGDVFANFGFYGVIMGIFWALFMNVFDNIVIKTSSPIKKSLIFVLISSMYVTMARGSVYNSFFILGWGLIFLYLISQLFKRKIKV